MKNEPVKRKPIPKKVREEVYKMYDGHCAYCGCELEYKDMQVDHVESLYWYNGANDISNYKPTCRMCNFYKSTFTLEEFRKELLKIRERLEKVFVYRLSRKYGLIEEIDKKIKFYFEEMEESK
ncbi:HNH endonuclease [Clostridium perfringens]|uniref:HNH endonuclease n=1 Tax=Clostridium perfringens TaxID=1502 RepID=UPI00096A3E38|nr:HNH endonuclease signature motif containing protein [Clostridium perfringens]